MARIIGFMILVRLPPTPEEFTTSLWSEVNALKDVISMPARDRPWEKTM